MSVQKRTWDPNKTFDLTSDELRAIQERAQRASKLRADWQKKLSSPYKPVGSYIVSIFHFTFPLNCRVP